MTGMHVSVCMLTIVDGIGTMLAVAGRIVLYKYLPIGLLRWSVDHQPASYCPSSPVDGMRANPTIPNFSRTS